MATIDLKTILAVINLMNTLAPEVSKLLSGILHADPSKPIGEILAETGNQWDENTKQAIAAMLR